MTERAAIDYTLYLVTDRGLARGRSLHALVSAAVHGGVTAVQLREKDCTTREFIEQALVLRELLSQYRVSLIINDRLDVALAVNADGVHLGQSDMPLDMARAITGPGMIIGISVESLQAAMVAEVGGADYLGISPIFATSTKSDTAPPLGLEGLRRIRQAVKIPLVGIGGLHNDNAGDVIRNGADGVAVVSAIVAADDPSQAAATLRQTILRARKGLLP